MTTKNFDGFEKELAAFVATEGIAVALRVLNRACSIVADEKRRLHSGDDVVQYWQDCATIVEEATYKTRRLE